MVLCAQASVNTAYEMYDIILQIKRKAKNTTALKAFDAVPAGGSRIRARFDCIWYFELAPAKEGRNDVCLNVTKDIPNDSFGIQQQQIYEHVLACAYTRIISNDKPHFCFVLYDYTERLLSFVSSPIYFILYYYYYIQFFFYHSNCHIRIFYNYIFFFAKIKSFFVDNIFFIF